MEKERFSVAIEPELLAQFDAFIQPSGGNRSEAVRDLIRARLIEDEWCSGDNAAAVATVTIIYDHHQRKLADRLLEVGHDHHETIITNLHVHLDHHNCLEVIVLRGRARKIQLVANELIAMKGVKHGKAVFSRADV